MRGLLLVALPLLASAISACGSETTTLSGREIVSNIPWRAPEVARYRLMEGDEVKGSGLLRIESGNGEFTFRQEFESEEFRNEVVAVTDARTLQAKTVDWRIEGPEGPRRWQVEYEGAAVTVVDSNKDEERHYKITAPTLSYDSWTDLFLWRTIEFREGYEATYADVLSATLEKPHVISQTVEVIGMETVEVPAGTFQAWRLEIRSADGKQRAWYAASETRPLVRYDNGRSLVFELLSLE